MPGVPRMRGMTRMTLMIEKLVVPGMLGMQEMSERPGMNGMSETPEHLK